MLNEMSSDEFYALEESFENFKILKLLYDRGYDISHLDYRSHYYTNGYNSNSFVFDVLNILFDKVIEHDNYQFEEILMFFFEDQEGESADYVIAIKDKQIFNFTDSDFTKLDNCPTQGIIKIKRGTSPNIMLIYYDFLYPADLVTFFPTLLDLLDERRTKHADKHSA